MKNVIKTWLLLLFLACFITSAVQAEKKEVLQGRTLTGVVLDEQGLPAIGANVLVKGTTIGVATDADGKYRIEVPQGNQTIIFSYVGYRTREITYKGQASLNVSLEPDSEVLDDVVVVGYGVQKKVNLTGAVGSVEGDQLASKAVGNVTSALAGLVPGLKVMNRGGKPGNDGAELNIRGFGSRNGAQLLSDSRYRKETSVLMLQWETEMIRFCFRSYAENQERFLPLIFRSRH